MVQVGALVALEPKMPEEVGDRTRRENMQHNQIQREDTRSPALCIPRRPPRRCCKSPSTEQKGGKNEWHLPRSRLWYSIYSK